MADDTLKNTLPSLPTAFSMPKQESYPSPGEPGGSSTYNEGVEKYAAKSVRNIQQLERSQASPEQLKALQSLLSMGTRTAYRERQTQEMGSLAFDPTKVSGNTFSSIIGNMEQRRGEEASNIYSTNFNAYREIQDEIQKRIEYIQDWEQRKREYMTAYKYGTKAAGKMLTGGGDRKDNLKAEKENFNREYITALQRAGKDTAYMNFAPSEIRQSILELQSRGYGRSDIENALIQTGIPTFPGSIAASALNIS